MTVPTEQIQTRRGKWLQNTKNKPEATSVLHITHCNTHLLRLESKSTLPCKRTGIPAIHPRVKLLSANAIEELSYWVRCNIETGRYSESNHNYATYSNLGTYFSRGQKLFRSSNIEPATSPNTSTARFFPRSSEYNQIWHGHRVNIYLSRFFTLYRQILMLWIAKWTVKHLNLLTVRCWKRLQSGGGDVRCSAMPWIIKEVVYQSWVGYYFLSCRRFAELQKKLFQEEQLKVSTAYCNHTLPLYDTHW